MYKVLNARAELLFCLLDLLFFHVLVAVAVMVCLRLKCNWFTGPFSLLPISKKADIDSQSQEEKNR